MIDSIQSSWGWCGIKPVHIIAQNDFGNLIILDVDGQYWRLCPEDLYCEVVAQDETQFAALKQDPDFLLDWQMAALVHAALQQYGPLAPGDKFHLVIPGVLGGEYDISNIRPLNQLEQLRFAGDLAQQVANLADGDSIELNIID